MEEKVINEAKDELYGGNPAVMEDALEQMDNVRKLVKDRMKEADKEAKELEKETASEKSRHKTPKGVKTEKIIESKELKEEDDDEEVNISADIEEYHRYTVCANYIVSVCAEVI